MQPGWELKVGELLPGSPHPAKTWTSDGAHGRLPAAAVVRVPGLLAEDSFDRQPLLSEDGDTLFVCQVRLDNREELLRKLSVAQKAEETPDSFLLQQAFLKWGEACLDHVYGDFAFAAYIRSRGQVFCAVDHRNHYRLFYRDDGGRLLLGTQLAALSKCPGVTTSVDPVTLGLLAEGRGPRTRTPFFELQALAGGHALRWRASRTEVFPWWNPSSEPVVRFRQSEDYVENARELFERAVQSCLRASAPVSGTLSGGLDSSLVVATAAKLIRTAGEGMTVYTAAPDPANQSYRRFGWEPDDAPYAAQTAALHENLRHVILRSDARVALDLMRPIHERSGTPIRNGANHLWIESIARSASARGSRVILTGAHGNFGISHSGLGAFRELFLKLHWGMAARLALNLRRGESVALWKTVATGLMSQRLVESALERRRDRLHPETLFAHLTAPQFRKEHAKALQRRHGPARLRKEFVRRATAPAMLWSADTLPQWGVELRDPTADRRLLEVLLTFPLAAFTAMGRWRGLARELGRDLLPDAVRFRRTAGQQAADYACAMRQNIPRYRELIDSMGASPACCEILDIPAIEHAIGLIANGQDSAFLTGQLDRACDVALFLLTYFA
jgi:asparagine synthase (glutamine-hydrolysing)